MPWNIRQRSGKYCVFKEGEDSPITCHDTRREATAHLRALYAHEPKGLVEVEVKTLQGIVGPNEDTGSLSALFSTFDRVDKDGDIVLSSAFTHGQKVPLCWGHDWSRPIGAGVITVGNDGARFDGNFFLDTAAGMEAYKSVKAMSEQGLQEYSWGFRVTESDYEQREGKRVRLIKGARIFEVSPVLVGAGEGTRTLAIKSADEMLTGDIDQESHEDRIDALNEALAEKFGAAYTVKTYADSCLALITNDAEIKYYRIPYALDDMGDPVLGEPVEARPDVVPVKELTYANQAQKLLADGRAFLDRTKALVALRREQRKSGRVLSQTNRDRLSAHPGALRQVADDIDTLLNETIPPEKGADPPDTLRLFVEYQRLRAGQMGRLFDGVRNAHAN